jgi:acyl-CoA reductase-like NAD-dependent aldehyde dehydrogenase
VVTYVYSSIYSPAWAEHNLETLMLEQHYAEHGLLLDGAWRGASDGATLISVNPATEETLGEIPQASTADVNAAIDSAADGFARMRALTAWERAALLRRAAQLVKERADILGRLVSLETGSNCLVRSTGLVCRRGASYFWLVV